MIRRNPNPRSLKPYQRRPRKRRTVRKYRPRRRLQYRRKFIWKKLIYFRQNPRRARCLRRSFSQRYALRKRWYRWRKRIVGRRLRYHRRGFRRSRRMPPSPPRRLSRWRRRRARYRRFSRYSRLMPLPQRRGKKRRNIRKRRVSPIQRLKQKLRAAKSCYKRLRYPRFRFYEYFSKKRVLVKKRHRTKKLYRFRAKRRMRRRWWKLIYRSKRRLRRLRRLHRVRRFTRKFSFRRTLRLHRKKIPHYDRPRGRRKGYMVRKFRRIQHLAQRHYLPRKRYRCTKYLTPRQQKHRCSSFIRPRYIKAHIHSYTKRAIRRRRKKGLSLQQSMDFFFVSYKEKGWERKPGRLLRRRLRRRRGRAKWGRLAKLKHKRRRWTVRKSNKRWWQFCRRVRPIKRYRGARNRRPIQTTGRRLVYNYRYRKYKIRIFSYYRTLPSRRQEVRLFLNRHARRPWRSKRRRRKRRRPVFLWRRRRRKHPVKPHRVYAELRRASSGHRGFIFRLPRKPRTRREFELSQRIRYRLPSWSNTLFQKQLLQRAYYRGRPILWLSRKFKHRRRRRPSKARFHIAWRKTTKHALFHLLYRRRWKSQRQRRTLFRQYLKRLDIVLPKWTRKRARRMRLRRRTQLRGGYFRRRRVFRLRSDHNRWYKPRASLLPVARYGIPHRRICNRYRVPNLIFRRIKTYHPRHKMFRRIRRRRPRQPLAVLYPYRVLRFLRPPKTLRRWRKKRKDRSGLAKVWAPHVRYSLTTFANRFTLHTTPDQDIRNRSVLDLGRMRFRSPAAARRRRVPYHYAAHRYIYRLLNKRGRRLSKARQGVRSTSFLRKQRLYLDQRPANAFLSRYHRRLLGFAAEGTKRYFLPSYRLQAQPKGTRRLLPILHAALWRYRNSRQFLRLYKRFLRRRRGRARTPFLLNKKRRRRVRRLLKRVGKQRRRRVRRSWTFDLYKGLKVSGRSYLSYHQQLKPFRLRQLRKRTLRFRSGHARRTRRATHYILPRLSGLTFQRPMQPKVQRAHNITRYARTAVYSDVVRALYPILLRRFLPKVITTNAVSTTYWGMRASAPSAQLRDAEYHRLRRFRYNQEMKQQRNCRAEMLRCLQPRRIWAKPSSYWRRRYWLRRYNRRRYDFYVEDKGRFHSFLSPRRRLFLSRPSPETHWRRRTFLHPRQRHAASVAEGLIERRAPESTRIGYRPQQNANSFFARAYSTYLRSHKVKYTPVFGRMKSPRNRQFYVRRGASKEQWSIARSHVWRRRAMLGREQATSFRHPLLPRTRRRMRTRVIYIRRPIIRVKKLRKLVVHHPRYNPLRHNIRRNRNVLWNFLFAPWAQKKRTYRRWLGRIRVDAKYSSWKEVAQMCREGLPERTGLPWRYFKRVCKWFHLMPPEEQWPTLKPDDFIALRRRRRRMEWREPDGRFRKPYFALRRNEYRRAPWLQGMIFRNTIYSRQRWRAFRRDNGPRKQKRFRWLHRYCATVFRGKKYLRRWPRTFNKRNFQNFLGTPRCNNRRLASPLDGLANRLDVTILLLNLAPSIRWARFMARAGVIAVNGKRINQEDYRLTPGDYLRFNRKTIRWLRGYFTPYFNRRQPWYNGDIPKNITYLPTLDMMRFNRLPKYEDLPSNSRLNARLFRWYYLDGKR